MVYRPVDPKLGRAIEMAQGRDLIESHEGGTALGWDPCEALSLRRGSSSKWGQSKATGGLTEHQVRKAGSPKDRREKQAVPLRKVPQAQSKEGHDPRPLVLPELLQRNRRSGTWARNK